MSRYIAQRVVQSAMTVVLAAVLVFLLVRLTPGDPAALYLPREASPEQVSAVRRAWGLDDPLPLQFAAYVRNLASGDLGRSLSFGEPVTKIIAERLPATLELATAAMLLSLVLAIPLGVLSSLRVGSVFDNTVTVLSLGAQSVPSFWLGVQLILIFSLALGLLPSSGASGPQYLILPALTLAADVIALWIRVIRTEMRRVLQMDYVRTAHAKGVEPRRVLLGHAFRNAANPFVTVVGLRLGALLSGAVVTETVFAWPGVGRLMIQSVFARDYPLIQGIVLIGAVVFVVVHLFVDVMYAYLDPRVRFAAR